MPFIIHYQPFLLWEMEIQMGERMGRIRRIRTDFLSHAGVLGKKIKKNPFQSAESAPSVLPFVSPFPKGETADSSLNLQQ